MNIEILNELRRKTEKDIQNVFDELEKQSIELKIDEFNGHKREDFIIKFDRFEYHLNEDGEKEFVRIRLGIYLKDHEEIWMNFLEPVGEYITVYDLNREFIDEFINIKPKEASFGIDSWAKELNNIIPDSYYRRNVKEYEFVCYINNTISLFQGRNFMLVSLFINRSLDYLEKIQSEEPLKCPYIIKATEYLKYLFYYLKRNDLVDISFCEKHKIEERIKTKS